MNDQDTATSAQLADVDYTPPMGQAIPLGIQHVLAMFAGNITVPLLIALAAGPQYITVLIQIALLAAGSHANPDRWYWADWIPPAGCSRNKFCLCRHLDRCAKGGASLAAVFGASIVGGIFQMILGYFIPQIGNSFHRWSQELLL